MLTKFHNNLVKIVDFSIMGQSHFFSPQSPNYIGFVDKLIGHPPTTTIGPIQFSFLHTLADFSS